MKDPDFALSREADDALDSGADLLPDDLAEQGALRSDWETYGLTHEILDLIPGGACGFIPWLEGGLLVKTETGSCALWFYRGHEAGLAWQCQMFQIALQNEFHGFLRPLLWLDQRTYRRFDERNWLYLTDAPALRKVHFHNPQDLTGLIGLIRDYRTLTRNCGFYYGGTAQAAMIRKLMTAVQQIEIYKMLAEHRIRPTAFDRIFSKCFQFIHHHAMQALEGLKASAYQRLFAETNHRDRVLYNFTRHNLRMKRDGHVVMLRLNKCRRELPAIDLALCMARTGRANEWRFAWNRLVLEEYQKKFPVLGEEVPILETLLRFPWSLYRLCGRYYFNRVPWPIPQMVEKLERLLADEPRRLRFTDQFAEFMKDEMIGCR